MTIPDFQREDELFGKGYRIVAGIDEAGRGPLAGPVVAGAVAFANDAAVVRELLALGLRDSKQVSEKKREQLYEFISREAQGWAVGIVSEKIIDEINILNATKLAMKDAVSKLELRPDFVLIDGNATLFGLLIDQLAIPKADEHIISVSAASIMAKVTRDRILVELDEKYPGYGFRIHKGYGTKFHMDALREKGPCEAHRRSFEPIKSMVA
ncbi:MAG: ribonuclease HII [Candidatus Pacebacteria bacterium]|jgi:ribonuclease HII|nr:ribonuclease HII [Candidatus Paceibacterota bacterium]